jgi:Flavin-binding monooxygenase-like
MAYTSFSFPPSTPVFPRASVVLQYLNDYALHFHLMPHIRVNTTVEAVHRDPSNSQWEVTLTTNANSTETLTLDLVVVCNGHYHVPLYPEVPGLNRWLQTGRATHSAYYRRPHNIGNVVLVIGGGPSGLDISSEMCSVAKTVIHSVTGATNEDVGNLKRRSRVVHFHEILSESGNQNGKGQVTFEDGRTESGIDHCILATGFQLSFPFLHDDIIHFELPPCVPPLPRDLYYTKYGIFPLAKHMFLLQNPNTTVTAATTTTAFPPWSMAFMGRILWRLAPFPLLEVQARAILHAFAHPESLDPIHEELDFMARHEALRLKLSSDDPAVITKAWHRFEPLEQFAYRDALQEFASSWSGAGYRRVAEWEKDMYVHRGLLREVWVELEKMGKAEEWVRGVGKGDREGEEGKREWVEAMRKMLRWAEKSGLV